MNEQIIVAPRGGMVRRRENTNYLRAISAVAGDPAVRSMLKEGGKKLIQAARNYYNAPSSHSKASKTLTIEEVPMPIATGTRTVRKGPSMQTTKGGGSRIRHREVLDLSVVISANWTLDVSNIYDINPGLAATFPWFSTIASNYTEYKVHSLAFEYVPSCATTTTGNIIMTPLYDPQIPTPEGEIDASDQIDTRTGSAFIPLKCPLKPSKMNISGSRKLVRNYAMSGATINYDSGRFCLSTTSGAGAVGGKLYIDYDIELFAPRLLRPSTTTWLTPDNMAIATLSAATQTFTTGVSAALSFSMLSASVGNNLNVSCSPTIFSAPLGVYMVELYVTATDSSAEAFTAQFFPNLNNHISPVTTLQITNVASGKNSAYLNFVWDNTTQHGGTINSLTINGSLTGVAGTLQVSRGTSPFYETFLRFTLV